MNRTAFSRVLAELDTHAAHLAPEDLRSAFETDSGRFARFSLRLDDLLIDWSKTSVDARAMDLLARLAKAADVEARRDAMFAGDPINATEGRAVLHVALRAPRGARFEVDGRNVMQDVHDVLDRMAAFAHAVRSGEAKGATGKPITGMNITTTSPASWRAGSFRRTTKTSERFTCFSRLSPA